MSNTNSVPQGLFGPGVLFLKRTDIALATPVNVGFCQEFSYDLASEVKELYGQNTLPLLAARGTTKASGKIKAATISGRALNSVLWGGSFTAGQTSIKTTGATEIPTGATITPTVPDSGTFDIDLGVVNAATNEPLTLVEASSAGPATGQYSETSGAYTFASADVGDSVKISYAYTHTASGGQTLIYENSPIGETPTFQIDYKTILYGAEYNVRFFNAISTKLGMAHKLTDFAMPELDFSFFCNAAGQLYQVSLATTA